MCQIPIPDRQFRRIVFELFRVPSSQVIPWAKPFSESPAKHKFDLRQNDSDKIELYFYPRIR